MVRENPEQADDRQYYDYHLDRNGSSLEAENEALRQPPVSSMLPFMVAVRMAIQFKEWCDNHAWEEDYREQRTHTTGELFDIFNSSDANSR